MVDLANVNISDIKHKLIEQSIKINKRQYITRETLKNVFSLDYKTVKALTKSREWYKIAEKIKDKSGRPILYFPVNKINDTMLSRLVKYATERVSNQLKEAQTKTQKSSSQNKNSDHGKNHKEKSNLKEAGIKDTKTKVKKEKAKAEMKREKECSITLEGRDKEDKLILKAEAISALEASKAELEEKLRNLTEIVNEMMYYLAEILYELQVFGNSERLKSCNKYEKFCTKWEEWNDKLKIAPLFHKC